MFRLFTMTFGLLGVLLPASLAHAEVWAVTGMSSSTKDPTTAAKEAAEKLKAALGDRKPVLVLVFEAIDRPVPKDDPEAEKKRDAAKQEILDAVAAVADKSIIYGCTSRGRCLTRDGADATVALMALGGDLQVTAAKAVIVPKSDTKTLTAVGESLAEALQPAYEKAAAQPGRAVILLGPIFAWGTQPLLTGLAKTLGPESVIAGAATTGEAPQYFQGQILRRNAVAILLSGNFSTGTGMGEGAAEKSGQKTPEEIAAERKLTADQAVSSAKTAVAAAVGSAKDDTRVLLAFSCCSRGFTLAGLKRTNDELEVLNAAVSAPILGFYGESEFGRPTATAPAVIKAHYISLLVLRKPAPASAPAP